MKTRGLATDYDGTIASHGLVAASTSDALQQFKESGRKLILVTGRELSDLFNIFPQTRIFDRVVAENGAVLYQPETERVKVLAPSPPVQFLNCLRERGVRSLSIGQVIVATQETYHGVVSRIIEELQLDLQIILNKGAVMVLPREVDKATGLLAALEELGIAPSDIVGVGDAENDHAFLRICGCSAAVANALPSLKDEVRIMTASNHGRGVEELIARILASDLADLPAKFVQPEFL